MTRSKSVDWTREHTLIALNLYYKLPFGQFDQRNPLIVDVATRMGRTPSSLAMKLSNLASLDPVQKARGIRGLSGASKSDREMWAEFQADSASLGSESEQLLHDLYTRDDDKEVDFLERDRVRTVTSTADSVFTGSTDRIATIRVRRGQQFFRQSILNAYDIKCCITGIAVPRLLVASHIRPWSAFPDDRLNTRNGLCLSSLHDAAFDSGLITIDAELRVVLSRSLKAHFPNAVLEQNFFAFEGRAIELPRKLAEPDPGFLAYHRASIFQS